MWFNRDELGGRKWSGWKKRSGHRQVLHVSASASSQKKARMRRTAVFVLVPVIAIVAAGTIYFGIVSAGRAMFTANERFAITNLDIRAGDVTTVDLIKEYTGIKEGMCLFEMNIEQVRRDFLRSTPHVKSMDIVRQLPGTMKIAIVERVPVARIGTMGSMVVDEDGCVFWHRTAAPGLPVIAGYKGEPPQLGATVSGMAQAAIEALDVCEDPGFGMSVGAIDIGNDGYLALYANCAGTKREIDVAWKGMGKRTAESKRHLSERLSRVAQTLQSVQGRKMLKINATYDDGRITGE
jgi:hypothetical protein